MPRERLADSWQRYGQLVEEFHGVRLRPGEDRMLVMNTCIGETLEDAKAIVRAGHDELRKLIWPNTVKMNPQLRGKAPPSLEESMASGQYVVGTPDAVRDQLLSWCAELEVEYLTIFPHYPGMVQRDTLQQLECFSREVGPALAGEMVNAAR